MDTQSVQSQQEQEQLVAQWLLATPGFFDRHPSLLASLELANTHDGKVVSLQEKQMAVLRNQNRDLNTKLAQMLRFGTENDRTQSLMVAWLEQLLISKDQEELSQSITTGLNQLFDIGKVIIVHPEQMSDSLKQVLENQPVCGEMSIAKDLMTQEQLMESGSIAMIPLQYEKSVLGALVLMSENATKFSPTVGLTYLEQFGKLAGAALYRFRKD
jgi:uncharacterized protein YigA (DUF484 family)